MKEQLGILLGLLLATAVAMGQKTELKQVGEDVGSLKVRAEGGDAQAQVKLATGKAVFTGMKSGLWPEPPSPESTKISRWLRMQGVAISPKEKLVIIGNRTLAEGEQTYLSVEGQFIRLTCLTIDTNSVQVQIEGEPNHARPKSVRSVQLRNKNENTFETWRQVACDIPADRLG